MNIREADGVAHLIQKCRDDTSMSYDTCASYLKECCALVEKTNRAKPPRTLMHVVESYDSDQESVAPTKSYEEVCRLFHTMSKASGLKSTYNNFKSKDFRDSLYIPQAIWDELEPTIREEVNKARAKAKEKQAKSTNSNNVSKLPDQYPSKKNQETLVNLCSSIADMGFEDGDDDSTDDEALTSHVYMAKTIHILEPTEVAESSDEPILKVRAHLEYSKQ